jgi:SAM-dependent methyltransferase
MAHQAGQLWEAFWADLPDVAGEAFWDCAAAHGAAGHVRLFQPHFDPALPLVDLGCGNGTQTRYLASVFDRVVGADISEHALALAGTRNAAANIEYLKLDVLDQEAVRALLERLGDVNLYLSGVLHQLPVADRLPCARQLARLAGARGCVFDQELTPASYRHLGELIGAAGYDLPKLDRVATYFRIGLQPAAGEAELETVYAAAGFTILDSGDLWLRTTETLPDGTCLNLPTRYVVVRPTAAGSSLPSGGG